MGREISEKNIKIEVRKAEKMNDIGRVAGTRMFVLEARITGGFFETMGC